MATILLVDDEPDILTVIGGLLKEVGYTVTATPQGEEALRLLREQDFDLLISDIRMHPIDGMQILRGARELRPDMSILMLTAFARVSTAVEAMKLGAFDYLRKPVNPEELLTVIRRALMYRAALRENRTLRRELDACRKLQDLVSTSQSMQAVRGVIQRAATSGTRTIFLHGEEGAGKKTIARIIHAHSPLAAQPIVMIPCRPAPLDLNVSSAPTGASSDSSALRESLLARVHTAGAGAVLIEEPACLTAPLQSELLKLITEDQGRHTPRLIFTSLLPPATLIADGKLDPGFLKFRDPESIRIPSVRERKEDVVPLFLHLARRRLSPDKDLPILDPEAQEILEAYAWPGNIREIESVVRRSLQVSAGQPVITREMLPARVLETVGQARGALPDTYKRFKTMRAFLATQEKTYVQRIVDAFQGDKIRAAQSLEVSVATLRRKLPVKNGLRPAG